MILLEFIGKVFLTLLTVVAVLFAICLILGVLIKRFPDEIKKKGDGQDHENES
ncbi:MAG: hypothetical protein QM221_09320 [Bacillota bacterium]|nr:hypothetical protein [Bacillota bacterium]